MSSKKEFWEGIKSVPCPECNAELMEFLGCSVYDFIGILMHDYQPFKSKEKVA